MNKLAAGFIFALTFHFAAPSYSQQAIQLSFSMVYGSNTVSLFDSSFHALDENKFQIDVLKFYVTNVRLLKNEKRVFQEKNSYHLIDASLPQTLDLKIESGSAIVFDEIQFNLGIDSSTNVAGVLGGALDPSLGMYWTWQTGYINFKLEGQSNLSAGKNHSFQFHLGGYKQPYYVLQPLTFRVENSHNIQIALDVKRIFDSIDLHQHHHIMSPNQEALDVSRIIANSFHILLK